MKKIPSFTINHLTLLPGLYVSRKDFLECEVLTTFDIRLTAPNREPVLNTGAIHAIEHLGATYLRNNNEWKDKVIYFGPMGCRTGFYLILVGNLESKNIIPLMRDLFAFIREYDEDIPGTSAEACGNYGDMDLNSAKTYADKYYNDVLNNIDKSRLNY